MVTAAAHAAVVGAGAFAPVDQDYLFQARQMQAMSFAAHIPLVCFGVAFPALVMFVEWLHLRTGKPLYLTLARRWSKIMLALFAVGVVTGTILSFELGLLWPNFMATFGDVFGLGFAVEGFSFFVEAIFIAVYIYGWGSLSPRAHFLTGIPIVISGFTGSLMVIAVNGWMNHPTGFRLENGQAVDVHPFAALFENGYLRAGGARDPADDCVARRTCAGDRRRLGRPRRRKDAAGEARRPRRARDDDARGTGAPARLVRRARSQVRDSHSATPVGTRLP